MLRTAPAPAARRDAAAQPTFDLVTTREGFDALEDSWNALFQRAGRDTHLFQTFNWLWHWANHFLPGSGKPGPELAIVTGRVDGRLAMVWPLVLERTGPIRRLGWMGDPVSQYGDVLMDERPDAHELLGAAWDFVIERTGANVVQLRKVRADSVVAPFLAAIGASVTAELRAPFLDLASAPSFSAYETRYSTSARRKRKRMRRKLEERGALAVAWHTDGAEAEALAAEAFRLKLIWVHQRGVVSPSLTDPRTARFFADATRAETRPAGCHVLALTCGGRPVALEVGVRCKGRTVVHVIAYDTGYEKMSTGALLMEDSIRRAADNGMAVFDILAPADGYKLEWADDAAIVRDWAVPLSMLGRTYALVYLGLVRTAVKRGFDALPLGLRRRLTAMLSR